MVFKDRNNPIFIDDCWFCICFAYNMVILGATLMDHEKLLNYSKYEMRYENKSATARRNTQLDSYITDDYY